MQNWQYFSERNDQFKIRTFGPLSGTYVLTIKCVNSNCQGSESELIAELYQSDFALNT